MSDDTRVRILDAALALLAEEGLQALSHRAVEKRAEVSHGSTTYHFKTRDALIEAMLGRLVDIERGDLERAVAAYAEHLAGGGSSDNPDLRAVMASLVTGLMSRQELTLARFELFLYAARRPHLQSVVADWRQTYVDLGAAMLATEGAAAPAAGSRLLAAVVDGMQLHQLSAPHQDVEQLAAQWYALTLDAALRLVPPSAQG
ncbi:TetR/AcrR family transcriptional regulator [Arsenicicoccus dermatophilus]|uniref:TetR/AcrR family transcriptional regulator n=1 Tax=Arsenicicoccus dermatophilus TaxID=1076331 RepID=UPI00391729B0